VTYGTVEETVTAPKIPYGSLGENGLYLGETPSPFEGQFTPLATIKADKTASWAKEHWNDASEFSQDCTNFVSKALNRGGGMRMKGIGKNKSSSDVWWRKDLYGRSGRIITNSHSWTVANTMVQFFLFHSDGNWLGSAQSKAKVGDIVFFDWAGKGKWDHSGVITKMKKGKAYVTAHNNNRLNQAFDVYMKSKKGTTATIVRVKPGWY
jgi:hypothetical protein